jgi:predicted NAD/FAD-binding protein
MKIGIIGSGGAGICAAWLLDGRHDITLFEKRNYLGGHTHSVNVEVGEKKYIIDDGAAWFSPSIYPYFNAYLETVGVGYNWLPLSLTFYNKAKDQVNCMPPVSGRNILKLFTKKKNLRHLLALNRVVNASKKLVTGKETCVDFETFIDNISMSESTRDDFIKPLLSGVWGAPYDQTNSFSIYPLMKYIVYHKPSGLKHYKWKVMKGGTRNYISTVHDTLKRTHTVLDTEVERIEHDDANNTVRVYTKDGVHTFDKVIITGGARDAGMILRTSPDYQKAHKILDSFKYYKATLATHSDLTYMPPDRQDWSIVNVTFCGIHSYATIWHGSGSNTDIFCSYVNAESAMPEHLHHVSEWWLPCETPRFYELQKELAEVQGLKNVYFGGDYTHDIGSHEDAILSAVSAVEKIDPGSERLIKLKRDASLIQGKN